MLSRIGPLYTRYLSIPPFLFRYSISGGLERPSLLILFRKAPLLLDYAVDHRSAPYFWYDLEKKQHFPVFAQPKQARFNAILKQLH
jgi:hypothetical protein